MLTVHNQPKHLALTAEEAMQILRISRKTFYEVLKTGALRSYKVGRRRYCTVQAIVDFQSQKESENAA
ncbi:MAG: helix-turn-helix domain-containing protein [Candidatus Thiodiazotropha sp.]|nr:helix-turn-helix domain-containing protein [Candidatus Thiodiazotropha sp. (ex Codakia orbicularis)]